MIVRNNEHYPQGRVIYPSMRHLPLGLQVLPPARRLAQPSQRQAVGGSAPCSGDRGQLLDVTEHPTFAPEPGRTFMRLHLFQPAWLMIWYIGTTVLNIVTIVH